MLIVVFLEIAGALGRIEFYLCAFPAAVSVILSTINYEAFGFQLKKVQKFLKREYHFLVWSCKLYEHWYV